ncbi:MAG: bifunctional phosphoribosylaminoimidazolecarboxamide formyltransferase/IMP cyclohydrolase [Nitrososphaerales archaeon]
MEEHDKDFRPKDDLRIKTAMLSTFEKDGMVEFARKLRSYGTKLIATGGTLSTLQKNGLEATPLEKIGHFPEMLEGRVKTLQPEIFAGILARKTRKDHLRQISEKGIGTIDMVVCNFYAFEAAAAKKESSEEEVIEMIDIGGPSMVRAAAKNFESICVVPSSDMYQSLVSELEQRSGAISYETRRRNALRSFEIVASYDISIFNTLSSRFNPDQKFPSSFYLAGRGFEVPKYGENPDQKAMIYSIGGASGGVPDWKQLFGDTRSYNNYLDIGSSYEMLKGFEAHPAAATVKHGQISGFAFSTGGLAEAYRLAHACDPEADFGNITVLNRTVDEETARLVGRNEKTDDDSVYTELVLAPGYETKALEILKAKQKKKMRIILTTNSSTYPYDLKFMEGLVLVQEPADYAKKFGPAKISIETSAKPTKKELAILLGLWEVVRRVTSNGIIIGNGEVDPSGALTKLWTLGVGSFRKRNGATKIAIDNAGSRAKGAYCASDGFFPFSDSVEMLGQAGVKGIIQPGGSQNDRKVIEASDRYSIPMLITHERAFKH